MADGPPKKKCKLSAVWNHFTKSAQSNSTAVCCYCKKFLKSSGNMSNLWDHLSRCSLYLASKKKQPLPIDESPSTSTSGPLKPAAQRTLENCISNAQKYESESRRKKEIDEAVALMVIKDFQPFSIVNDEGFVNLVRVLDPRFLLYLNTSTSLTINFSQQVVRKIYFNQTINLSRSFKSDQRTVVLPCALRGQYDIFVQARQRGSIKIEAQAAHPQSSWPLLNRTHYISIRSQNRVRKRQMIVKWDKSKFDFHAVHYCLVVNTRQRQLNFCSAVNDYFMSAARRVNVGAAPANCYPGSLMDYIWLKPPERAKKIDPRITNIICTGSHTQQLLRGVLPNHTYYLDVFGVHTRRQNLTFHIASTQVDFNRTHPVSLRANMLTMKKISGLHGAQVFSFKIPTGSFTTIYNQFRASAMPSTALQLRYLILPCGGSEIDAKILRQRRAIGNISGIYRPTYIRLSEVQEGERYIVRFTPSNEDEMLRANKVGLAVTTNGIFQHLPELPENITVFEVRTRCSLATIAWYSSPDNRTMRYCIIVFNLPQRNRSSIDYTNYCLDFGKRVMQHPLFDSIKCVERTKSSPLETHTIFNLTPGETYLIYVTANLSEGKPLPYQSLRITMNHQCSNELLESREQLSYY